MKQLTRPQLIQLEQALRRNGPHQALQAELVDHLASEIEHLIDGGQAFEAALQQVMQEASPQAVAELKQTYQQMLNHVPQPTLLPRLSLGRRGKRRSVAEPFQQWLQGSVVAFITLMVCLTWVSQLFALPLDAFGGVWLLGLVSLLVALSARLLFRRRPRRLKHRWVRVI